MVNIKNNSAGGKSLFSDWLKDVYIVKGVCLSWHISVELIGDLSLCVAECSGQCLVVVVFLQDGSKLSISVCVCVCMCVYVCV